MNCLSPALSYRSLQEPEQLADSQRGLQAQEMPRGLSLPLLLRAPCPELSAPCSESSAPRPAILFSSHPPKDFLVFLYPIFHNLLQIILEFCFFDSRNKFGFGMGILAKRDVHFLVFCNLAHLSCSLLLLFLLAFLLAGPVPFTRLIKYLNIFQIFVFINLCIYTF